MVRPAVAAIAPSARRPAAEGVAAASAVGGRRDSSLTKKPLKIRTEDFRPYRTSPQLLRQHQLTRRRRRADGLERSGLDGALSVHVYCGHGLRATPTSLRDLYCVVGVDGLNRARTAVQTGAINFDWDEKFQVDVLDAESVSFGVYSWTPVAGAAAATSKQKLFFTGTVHLREFLQRGGPHQQLALRLDPTGVLYVELEYLDVSVVYWRAVRGTGIPRRVRRVPACCTWNWNTSTCPSCTGALRRRPAASSESRWKAWCCASGRPETCRSWCGGARRKWKDAVSTASASTGCVVRRAVSECSRLTSRLTPRERSWRPTGFPTSTSYPVSTCLRSQSINQSINQLINQSCFISDNKGPYLIYRQRDRERVLACLCFDEKAFFAD